LYFDYFKKKGAGSKDESFDDKPLVGQIFYTFLFL